MDFKDYFDGVEEFIEEMPARKMVKLSFRIIKPQKGSFFSWAISIIVAIVISVVVGFSQTTVKYTASICSTILTIQLSLFGILFTVYAIILAFLNDSYVKKLVSIKYKGGISYLKHSTTYYESILFLYFIGLSITGVTSLFVNIIDESFLVSSMNLLNNLMASILLFLYFTFSFRLFYEIKSVIYNTVTLFRASIVYKLLDFARGGDNNADSPEGDPSHNIK